MEAYVAVEHPASAAVLKHCGFVQEGILRKLALLSDGRYHDMVLMSILKEDILFWTSKGEVRYEKNIRYEI